MENGTPGKPCQISLPNNHETPQTSNKRDHSQVDQKTLSKAGVDTSIFKAHSIRAASTSAAADAGVSIPEILQAADWSSKSTFEQFYHKPVGNSTFSDSVLKIASNLQS
jgi:hypothetical protein